MKKLILLVFVIAAIITIDSCRRDKYIPLCYGNDIQPILTKNCTNVGCHNSVDKARGYIFTNYKDVMQTVTAGSANKSKLYSSISGSHPEMPKGRDPLTKKELAMIKSWIDFGAKDCGSAATGTTSNCDTTSVTYNTHVKKIIDDFCIGCHSSTLPTMNNYNELKNAVTGGLFIPAVKQTGPNPMPQGGPKLSNCDLRKIDLWIQAGMPQ